MLDHARYAPRLARPHHIAPGQGKLDESILLQGGFWSIEPLTGMLKDDPGWMPGILAVAQQMCKLDAPGSPRGDR
jgi:hypothetical protein